MVRIFLLSCFLIVVLGSAGCRSMKTITCDTSDPVNSLPWLKSMVAEMEKAGADNKDAEITQHTYYNRIVFYVQSRCCDRPNELYDCDGNKICEPDGGITGKGDGKCEDFFEKREGNTLIWPRRTRKFAP